MSELHYHILASRTFRKMYFCVVHVLFVHLYSTHNIENAYPDDALLKTGICRICFGLPICNHRFSPKMLTLFLPHFKGKAAINRILSGFMDIGVDNHSLTNTKPSLCSCMHAWLRDVLLYEVSELKDPCYPLSKNLPFSQNYFFYKNALKCNGKLYACLKNGYLHFNLEQRITQN